MDNYTILITLIITLAVYAIFTAIVSRNTAALGRMEWRLSAILLFCGFFLLVFQQRIPPLISICIANYLILTGFYYQTTLCLILEFKKRVMKSSFLLSVSVIYWILFPYFTFVKFNTSVRIFIISLILVLFYTNASLRIYNHNKGTKNRIFRTQELYYLFLSSAVFYIFRALATALGMGKVNSIFDTNLITTISFIYIIMLNLINMMGVFNATLRNKNQLLIDEKNKLGSLVNFINDTARNLNLDDLYKSIEEFLKTSMHVDSAAIYLIDQGGESHSMTYEFNNLDLELDTVKTLKKGEGISGRAIEKDRVISIDVKDYPLNTMIQKLSAKGVTNLVSVPLKTADGIIGAITVAYTKIYESLFLDEKYVYYLGEQIALVLHNAFLYEKVSLLANTDPLTGLYNRRRMMEVLKKEYAIARRNNRGFTLIMADLDYFKQVNDNYGHDCGDEVLRTTAALFRKECRESDSLCRWGGEEFLLLFVDSDIPSTVTLSERIRKAMENTGIACMENKPVTLSIGVSAFSKEQSLEQIIAAADDALYTAKKRGRNRVETYDE